MSQNLTSFFPVKGLQVAIDGPSGSGKGTVAKMLSACLNLPTLDSGLLYRALACVLMDHDVDTGDEAAVSAILSSCVPQIVPPALQIEAARLRSETTAAAASMIASMPAVRQSLLEVQRTLAAQGCVMDGRDIATVVLPHAKAKFFLTASVRERAHRRWMQLRDMQADVSLDAVLSDLMMRDQRDTERVHAPLMQAEDAVLIDSTTMRVDEVVDRMLAVLERRKLIHRKDV